MLSGEMSPTFDYNLFETMKRALRLPAIHAIMLMIFKLLTSTQSDKGFVAQIHMQAGEERGRGRGTNHRKEEEESERGGGFIAIASVYQY